MLLLIVHLTLYINCTLLLYSVFIIALTSLSIELIGYHYFVPAEQLLIYIAYHYAYVYNIGCESPQPKLDSGSELN